jgi:ABC-type phosphate transport system substrate-binding protein
VKRLTKMLVLGSVAALAFALSGAIPAGATPPTGYGFDNTAHLIVGGGSDTTYKAMVNLTDLWDGAPGCTIVTSNGATLNNCVTTNANPETNTLGNYQHDTVAQANPTGSGSGISALINGTAYNGTTGSPSFARSSRGPSGSELSSATFWGFGEDGVQIVVFNNRGSIANGADPVSNPKMSAQELHNIWNCTYTTWHQVPSLGINNGDPNDGPIVPWGIQTSSGTYATFRDYIRNATGDSSFDPDAGACVRKLASTSAPPFENDIKPLINDPAVLSNSAASTDNPENWIWWGSFGELSTFSFKGQFTRSGTLYVANAGPVLGFTPNTGNIANNTYPIDRTLYHVTKNTDADCPQTSPGTCDFPGNPGPTIGGGPTTDLNVTGGSSGTSGAVREFTRWLCRPSGAQQTLDPYTGTNYNSAITTALSKAGFTTVPSALRSSGSRCQVLT